MTDSSRYFIKIRNEFKPLWKNYLIQSLLATVIVFMVLLFLNIEHAVIIASIGATAFIVFTMPSYLIAKPERVVGGHLIGLISGSLCALIPHHSLVPTIVIYSLAVGVSIFLMVVLNMEHPPASGTALGIAITGFSSSVVLAVITSSILLALTHHFCKKFLKDLI